jgi:hypothetical protein
MLARAAAYSRRRSSDPRMMRETCLPRDLQERAVRVDRAVADLSLDLQRQPTVAFSSSAVPTILGEIKR